MTTTTITDYDTPAKNLADANALLTERAEAREEELRAVRRRHRRGILAAITKVRQARATLRDLVADNPDDFAKPKTRELHGIKFGYQKSKGKLHITDTKRTLALIRKHLDDPTAEQLIILKETLDKRALAKLDAATLRRIGAEITDTGDHIQIRVADTDIDKLLDTILSTDDELAETEDPHQD